jgi:glycosyltransferase involved in cell wall biosynthesis
MENKYHCSFVIRAYNEEKHIRKLLEGILAQTVKEVEIILVDSGSTDQTVEIAGEYPVNVVRIDPEDFSFGYSLNRGIDACTNELVVIASAHVYPVYPDWLETLLKPFADPKVALTYGKQRGNETSKFSEHQLFRQWFPDGKPAPQDHPFCNNANSAIRKSFWQKTPYDEFLPGLEDLDWAFRVMKQGYEIQYVPDAEIIHVHQETPTGIYRRYLREGMAFKRIFPNEHFKLWDFLRLSVSNIFTDWQAAGNEKKLAGHWKDIVWFRVMQFWGTYQGYIRSGPLTRQLKQRFYYPNSTKRRDSQIKQRKVEPIQYNK